MHLANYIYIVYIRKIKSSFFGARVPQSNAECLINKHSGPRHSVLKGGNPVNYLRLKPKACECPDGPHDRLVDGSPLPAALPSEARCEHLGALHLLHPVAM